MNMNDIIGVSGGSTGSFQLPDGTLVNVYSSELPPYQHQQCAPLYQPLTGPPPHTCPVCQGKCSVPKGFYEYPGQPHKQPEPGETEPCRSCNGKGIVWKQ